MGIKARKGSGLDETPEYLERVDGLRTIARNLTKAELEDYYVRLIYESIRLYAANQKLAKRLKQLADEF